MGRNTCRFLASRQSIFTLLYDVINKNDSIIGHRQYLKLIQAKCPGRVSATSTVFMKIVKFYVVQRLTYDLHLIVWLHLTIWRPSGVVVVSGR